MSTENDNSIDIDKLLAEDEPEEQQDLNPAPPGQEKSPEQKALEKKNAENKLLKRELRKRQEEIALLKPAAAKPAEAPADGAEPVIDENDPAAKAWLKKINETTEAALKPIREANQSKALSKFVSEHPEYASSEKKQQLQECVAAAQGKATEEEILDAMHRSWAAQNYDALMRLERKQSQSRTNAQREAVRASATGEGLRDTEDFTERERAKAEEAGMSVEDYRRALAGFRSNSIIR